MAQLAIEPVALEFVWTKTMRGGITIGDGAGLDLAAWKTKLELNIASKTNGGLFENRQYSKEVIYSSSDQDYDFGVDKKW